MRQLDKLDHENTNFGSPVNRKKPEPPKPQKVREGIVELSGKLMTDIAKNLAAPDDEQTIIWSEYS